MPARIIFSLANNFYMSQKAHAMGYCDHLCKPFTAVIARKWMAVTMTIPNNSSAKRITVQIPTSSGDAIEAWVYQPEGGGPHPAMVMAHGIGGIKAGGLARRTLPQGGLRRDRLRLPQLRRFWRAAARGAVRPAPARGLQHRHRLGS
jgi:hypothetical protein